ncbi:MAG: hypothetical protein HY289_08705 [Planctomycetes bacterium]|nr:hypothetical protein [Planctomycetota bacterium]
MWPIGSAQTWLRAHIWLGLLCLPLLILHSGFRLGGTLTTTLMVVLILVILSGVWGLVLQNVLPRLMVEELPSEMTFAEMAYSVAQLVSAGDQLAAATSGVKADAATAEPVGGAGPVIVAVGRLASVRMPATPIAEAEGLAVFYREQVAPYLSGSDSPLASASRAATLFRDLKAQLPPAAHDAVDGLESLCRQRRYWDSQARMHFWLHNWLWVHYPLSVALLVLLAAHVVSALRYW